MKQLKGLLVDPETRTVRIFRSPRNNNALKATLGGHLVATTPVRHITPSLMLRAAHIAAGKLQQPPLARWMIDDKTFYGRGFLHGVDLSGGNPHQDSPATDCPIWVSEAEKAITWLDVEEVIPDAR